MKTTRKTCGRGQGCTKISSPVNQEFYKPSNNKDQKINKFKKFLLSNKFRKINLIILIAIPLTLSLHYFLLFVYKIDGFQILNYSIVTIFWIVFLYKNKLEYKKK